MPKPPSPSARIRELREQVERHRYRIARAEAEIERLVAELRRAELERKPGKVVRRKQGGDGA